MSRVIEFLETHQSPNPSHWRKNAQWRRDNDYWLKYSRYITMRVLQAMDEQSVTQVELSRRMGCTQQYVSNLLKGSSNMTLETIGRLEKALNIDILNTALSYVDGFGTAVNRHTPQYLNEPSSVDDVVSSETSAFVNGYAAGKKKRE